MSKQFYCFHGDSPPGRSSNRTNQSISLPATSSSHALSPTQQQQGIIASSSPLSWKKQRLKLFATDDLPNFPPIYRSDLRVQTELLIDDEVHCILSSQPKYADDVRHRRNGMINPNYAVTNRIAYFEMLKSIGAIKSIITKNVTIARRAGRRLKGRKRDPKRKLQKCELQSTKDTDVLRYFEATVWARREVKWFLPGMLVKFAAELYNKRPSLYQIPGFIDANTSSSDSIMFFARYFARYRLMDHKCLLVWR
ncbi:unnamed protein product [Orchesella dallaii]|uniref:Uncharacterized protein n=1 Tax=Orchesella dallaii TaxID=48710 RepID=A0ABP1R358_9HEXA